MNGESKVIAVIFCFSLIVANMVAQWVVLGVFGGYVSSSIFLLFFPNILHKKKKQQFLARHISHRGGAGERFENTMSAFDNAAATHTDMFEIDVQLTRDGEVVISHDDDLYRVSGLKNNISKLDYKDLPAFRNELGVTFTNGETVRTNGGHDESIVLLRSVLEKYPNIPLNIDTKLNNDVIRPTIDLIYEFDRKHNVVMANMRSEGINIIHLFDPELLLGVSIAKMGLIILLFYTGLLPFVPLKESFVQIPLPETLLLNQGMPIRKWMVNVMRAFLMNRVLFRHLQKRGMQVHLFVCNCEEHYRQCFSHYKVDGVMTDYPTKLRRYMSEMEERDPLIPR